MTFATLDEEAAEECTDVFRYGKGIINVDYRGSVWQELRAVQIAATKSKSSRGNMGSFGTLGQMNSHAGTRLCETLR
jgi:hypothetical protein